MNIKAIDRRELDLVIDLLAIATNVSGEDVKSKKRAGVARVRQIAMYLSHTVCQNSLTKVAQLFDRDKSTVGYAVQRIEDMRDIEPFDDWLTEFETVLIANRTLASGKIAPETSQFLGQS